MVFNDSKYTRWYNQIIEQAKVRALTNDNNTETHHVVPKSLGGSNVKDNLIVLTAREHFVCHWLLTKMVVETKQKYQMWNAFSCMLYRELPGKQRYKVSSRIFESIKTAGSKIAGEKNGMYGKKLTLEMIAKRTATLKANKLAKKLALGV